MLQNKITFNQSSVSLEIIGLPDYSNNENKDQISIISEWKLSIIDKPLIEGTLVHLNSVMDAFYSYSKILISEEIALFESSLIDIKTINYYTHEVLLKSSKPNVKPLNIKIGNAILSDIVNCFDQLRYSNNVKNIYSNEKNITRRKKYFASLNKHQIANIILPPFISLCSLFFISNVYIYFYNYSNERDNKSFLLDSKNIFNSINLQTR